MKASSNFSVSDKVLVPKGVVLITNKWPPFTSKYFAPCVVAKAKHPGCKLTSPLGRRLRSVIHAQRSVPFRPRKDDNLVTIVMSEPTDDDQSSRSEEEVKPDSSEQASAEEATVLELRTMRHEDLRQKAASETDACNVFFRLLGLSTIILEFHPPDSPYSTVTIKSDNLEELPSAAGTCQKKYIVRDPSALDLLLAVTSFYTLFQIKPGYSTHLENTIGTSFRQYTWTASIYRFPQDQVHVLVDRLIELQPELQTPRPNSEQSELRPEEEMAKDDPFKEQ